MQKYTSSFFFAVIFILLENSMIAMEKDFFSDLESSVNNNGNRLKRKIEEIQPDDEFSEKNPKKIPRLEFENYIGKVPKRLSQIADAVDDRLNLSQLIKDHEKTYSEMETSLGAIHEASDSLDNDAVSAEVFRGLEDAAQEREKKCEDKKGEIDFLIRNKMSKQPFARIINLHGEDWQSAEKLVNAVAAKLKTPMIWFDGLYLFDQYPSEKAKGVTDQSFLEDKIAKVVTPQVVNRNCLIFGIKNMHYLHELRPVTQSMLVDVIKRTLKVIKQKQCCPKQDLATCCNITRSSIGEGLFFGITNKMWNAEFINKFGKPVETIKVKKPNSKTRAQLWQYFISKPDPIAGIDISKLVEKSPSFTATDIQIVAAKTLAHASLTPGQLTQEDFEREIERYKKQQSDAQTSLYS